MMELIEAARSGQLRQLRRLIAAGADLNAAGADGETALLAAASGEEWEAVAVLLAAGADPNARDESGQTALHHAAGGDAGAVRLLLAAGADLEVEARALGSLCGTALHFAAWADDPSALRALLEAGANPGAANDSGGTALMIAALSGSLPHVEVLLEHGADPNARNHPGGTALMIAAGQGHLPVVRRLIAAGADADARTEQGASALVAALQCGQIRAVRALLEAGADPNVTSSDGTTPLFRAARLGATRTVRRLLAAGAEPDAAIAEYDAFDPDLARGTTPLMVAALRGKARMAADLLAAGADPNRRNDRAQNALDLAASKGHAAVVERLLAAGVAGPADPGAYLGAALVRAAAAGNEDRVAALLAAGANPDAQDTEPLNAGMSALFHAAQEGHAGIVRRLLAAGANPDLPEANTAFTGSGQTPLHRAAALGHTEITAALLAAGADPNAADRAGIRPLTGAAEGGHATVLRLLLEAGADWETSARPDGRSALAAAASGGHAESVAALLRGGAGGTGDALVAAAQGGHPDVVRLLLATGTSADARETGDLERTALIAAAALQAALRVPPADLPLDERPRRPWLARAARRQPAVARLLLEAGADANARDRRGRTPLIAAAALETCLSVSTDPPGAITLHITGEVPARPFVEALLAAGAEIDARDDEGCTALARAAGLDRWFHSAAAGLVRALLAMGADPNVPDREGRTALGLAAKQGRKAILNALLRAGAQIDARDGTGATPLLAAAEASAAAVVTLARAGADVNAADDRGRTPLLVAVERRLDCAALTALLQAGADPGARDADGNTALDLARELEWNEAARLLERAGAPDDGARHRALRAAVRAGDANTAARLLREGADPGRRLLGMDAFRLAVTDRKESVLQELLAAGGDLNRLYPDGQTLLSLAIEAGSAEAAAALLRVGADPNGPGPQGWSPLLLAAMSRQEEIARLLQAAGAAPDERAQAFLAQFEFRAAAAGEAFRAAAADMEARCGVPGQTIEWLPGVLLFPLAPGSAATDRLREAPSSNRFWAEYQVLEERAASIVAETQDALRARGCFVWDLGHGIGCGPAAQFLGLAPTADPYAVLAAVGTAGGNYEVYPPDVIRWFRELDGEQPFALLGCGRDFVRIRFLQAVRDADALARRMYAFCPDLVDQGVESVEALAEHLRKHGEVRFWWD